MLLSTIESVAPYRIERVLGLVLASVPAFGSTYAEQIKDLNGKTRPDVSTALEARRIEALARLVALGKERGANAILGVRYDFREITGTWKELCVYGTAVIIAVL